jgi:hypothetical protein
LWLAAHNHVVVPWFDKAMCISCWVNLISSQVNSYHNLNSGGLIHIDKDPVIDEGYKIGM